MVCVLTFQGGSDELKGAFHEKLLLLTIGLALGVATAEAKGGSNRGPQGGVQVGSGSSSVSGHGYGQRAHPTVGPAPQGNKERNWAGPGFQQSFGQFITGGGVSQAKNQNLRDHRR